MASKGLEELQATLDDAGDVEVLEELQEISADALARQGEDAPVVRLVNVVLMSAIQKGASDIHIEPYEKELRVRYRIDGVLYNIMSPPMKFRDAISSRIKIMSKLDIAEKRLPQRERRRQGDRLPCLGAADALRREDRHASARQRQADARHESARLRAGIPGQVRGGHLASLGHGAGDGADGQRKDEHALLIDRQDQHTRNQHHDGRRSGRVQSGRHQPSAGAGEYWPEFRRRAPVVPPPGPQHHSGR
jgi:hypothetical protein